MTNRRSRCSVTRTRNSTITSTKTSQSSRLYTIAHRYYYRYPDVEPYPQHRTNPTNFKTFVATCAFSEIAHHRQRPYYCSLAYPGSCAILIFSFISYFVTVMADQVNGSPSLPNATPSTHPGRRPSPTEGTKEAVRKDQQPRKPRNRKPQTQSIPQLDGTVSDSVLQPSASPGLKKGPKQRQNGSTSAVPSQNIQVGRTNGHKPRPVSMGGNMLPATPAKEQAYAGPTFHASPAPSSLPVPKFFSRSVPNVAAQPSLQARMEGERTPEKEPSPEPDIISPPRDAESPLDMFFKADRAEKDKRRSGSNLLSPEMAVRQPQTEPRNPFQQSGKSIFLREMDGEDENMPSPKTIPPTNRPHPTERARSSPGSVPQAGDDSDDQRRASTQALKDLLFANVNNASTSSSTPPKTQPRAQSSGGSTIPPRQTPSPFQRSSSGPSTPAPSTEQNSHYALHYGNRNLSPMFKAVRNETPTRPSGLRQELPNDGLSGANRQQPVRSPPPQIDPNSFSRAYLGQQAKSSVPSDPPPVQFPNGTQSAPFPAPPSGSKRGVLDGQPSAASPRNSGSQDIKGMEDDLRRMLKLNVMG